MPDMKIMIQIECDTVEQVEEIRKAMDNINKPQTHRTFDDMIHGKLREELGLPPREQDALADREATANPANGARILSNPDQLAIMQKYAPEQCLIRLVALTDKGKEHKIEAIKVLRECSGFGLKQSKDAIEAINPDSISFVNGQVALAEGKTWLTFACSRGISLHELGAYFFFVVVPAKIEVAPEIEHG